MSTDTEHAETFTYRRRIFGEDRELGAFSIFLDTEYGVEDVHGDLEDAVHTQNEIDVTYLLDDARIEIESEGTGEEDWVNVTVIADDDAYARDIKNTIVSKADGEYDRFEEDGITYTGESDVAPNKKNYDTVEPFLNVHHLVRDWFSEDDGYDVTVRPIDDEIDASAGKRKYGRHNGEKYLSEASIDITNDDAEFTLHITRQKSDDDAAIQFRFDADDDDRMQELKRLVHGHYLATVEAEPGAEDTPWDGFVADDVSTSLADVGGLQDVKQHVIEDIIHPLKYPEAAQKMGMEPTNGALFYGPPGTGKTLMARAIAAEADATFYNVNMSELVSKYVGETEERINDFFDHVEENGPAVVFFDEADTAIPDREQSDKEYTRSQTNTILSRLDGFNATDDIITIAATNRKQDLDAAGQRSGRIDDEYAFTPPDRDGREEILGIKVAEKEAAADRDTLFADIDYDELAAVTDGATGADLETWVEKAVRHAAYRDGVDLDEPPDVTDVTLDDFYETFDDLDITEEGEEDFKTFQ